MIEHRNSFSCILLSCFYRVTGKYLLESDGAKAYDEALKLLMGPNRKLNFKSEKSYLEARCQELRERGIDEDEAESFEAVNRQIMDKLKLIPFKRKGVFGRSLKK